MEGRDPRGYVRLEAVSAPVFLQSQDHQHDLIRELALIDLGRRFDLADAELPHRVANLISDIHHDYADVRLETRQQALDAVARGEATVTLDVPIRPGMAEALQRWLRLVEDADAVCAQGFLLTVAASPEVRALRRWYVEELVRRLTS